MTLFKGIKDTSVPVRVTNRGMSSFRGELNNLMEDFFSTPTLSDLPDTQMDFTPRVDIRETDAEFLVEAELPAVDEKNIELSVENNVLILKGQKKEKKKEEEEEANYYHCERKFGSFYRTIPFSSEINEENISAKYKDGLLRINVAKSNNGKQSKKKIIIQAS